ncbi:MAG: hypothetical protein IKU10_07245 [Clostridia bacterium]|nr:hypothetical protein [Clostridia bacterium]
MKSGVKALLLVLCAIVLVVATVFTTLAYLQDQTGTVKNVFTIGEVDIDLLETNPEDTAAGKVSIGDGTVTHNYGIVTPGTTFAKDPTIEVKSGSEASYVFAVVTIDETQFTYAPADGWTKLDGVGEEGQVVYYRTQDATDEDVSYSVFANDQVTLKSTVANGAELTPIEITAKAIQQDATITDALTAWNAF